MSPAPGRRRRRGLLLVAAVGVLAAGLAVVWGIAHGLAKETAPAPSFKRLTFRQRLIGTARFAPDGQTIIYSSDSRLYMTRPQSPESNLFAFPGDILSISRSGELAILQNLRPVGRGILATVPMAGGAPRQVLAEVPYGGADWSPDGKNLVVAHVGDDKWRLESPIGKVLALGEFASPRFSADGSLISFWEVTGRTNSVGVIDRLGKSKKILSAGWTETSGAPCWASNGREIWFTAGKAGERPALWRVDLSGKLRLAIRVPGTLELDDISGDGRVLLTHSTALQSVRGLGPGQSVESDLSWLDGSMPADLSQDGSTLLLNEEGEGTGARPTIYLRSTDGSPALRLSEGMGMALSPDKQRVLAVFPAEGGKPARLVLLPTGPGEPKDLPIEKLEPDLGRIHAGREACGLQRRRPGSRGPALRSGHRGRQGACRRSGRCLSDGVHEPGFSGWSVRDRVSKGNGLGLPDRWRRGTRRARGGAGRSSHSVERRLPKRLHLQFSRTADESLPRSISRPARSACGRSCHWTNR